MPVTFHYKPEAKLVVCVHTGRVLDDEFLVHYKAMVESDLFATTRNLLIDLRDTDSSPRTGRALREFADFVTSKYADAGTRPKVAVIAPKDLSFGLARMYEAFAGSIPWDFVVFRSVDTALAWLRAPEDLMDDLDRKAQEVTLPGGRGATSEAS
jgi:hypothetical protein